MRMSSTTISANRNEDRDKERRTKTSRLLVVDLPSRGFDRPPFTLHLDLAGPPS